MTKTIKTAAQDIKCHKKSTQWRVNEQSLCLTEWKEKTDIRKYFLKLKVALEIGPQRRLHFDRDSWEMRKYPGQRRA